MKRVILNGQLSSTRNKVWLHERERIWNRLIKQISLLALKPSLPYRKNYAAEQYSNKTCKQNVLEVYLNFIRFSKTIRLENKKTICESQWRILILRSGLAEEYAMRHCTDPLDLTSESRFASVTVKCLQVILSQPFCNYTLRFVSPHDGATLRSVFHETKKTEPGEVYFRLRVYDTLL